jgi:hypothetical protein
VKIVHDELLVKVHTPPDFTKIALELDNIYHGESMLKSWLKQNRVEGNHPRNYSQLCLGISLCWVEWLHAELASSVSNSWWVALGLSLWDV